MAFNVDTDPDGDADASTCAILPCPDEEEDEPSSKLPQYAAAVAATLGAFAGGTVLAWTSPALPLLERTEGVQMTAEEASWVGSLMSLGAVVGAPPSGLLAQTAGRKVAVASLALPLILSCVLLLCTRSVAWVYVARFLAGTAMGGICSAIPIYVAEIAEDSIRGALGALLQVMFNIGILFAYAFGATGHYTWLNVACLLVPVVFFSTFVWMPETPQFLLSKGRTSQAQRSLQWLRGSSKVYIELQDMESSVLEDARKKGGVKDLCLNPAAVRAMIISMGLVAFQQLSGICVVLFYTQYIFEQAGSSLSASLSAVLVGVVMLVMSYVTTVLVDRAGRKVLLLVSSAVMGLSLGVLGLYFFLHQQNVDVSTISWLPLVAVIVYIIMYCLGLGPLPWTVMAEVLPPNVKGIAGSIVSSFCWLLSFAVTKLFSNFVEALGLYFAFWLFGIFCVFSTIFVALIVPETKNKSLDQIQNELEGTAKGRTFTQS